MIKLIQQPRTLSYLVIAFALTGCVRFETRMQANGDFDYQKTQLVDKYQTGEFSNDEARSKFNIPTLTESQKEIGQLAKNVDIRPPTQLMPVIDGVLLETGESQSSKIWFNAFTQDDDINNKVWTLLVSYLAENKIEVASRNKNLSQLQTKVHQQETVYGGSLNESSVIRQSSYRFSLDKQDDGHSVALNVELLTYAESNDGKVLNFKLTDKNKQRIELRFINNLLEFAYNEQQEKVLNGLDKQPLPIKLGFDDNHQIAWIVENEFSDTWRKLPELLTLLHFEIIDADKNMGYFLLKFTTPDSDYWQENSLNSFKLVNAEYFIQLGELVGGETSILWLDEEKKSLSDAKVTEIYLSITEQVRQVLLQNEKQVSPL